MAEYTTIQLPAAGKTTNENTIETSDSFVELMSLLHSVDTESDDAKMNETGMINNDGERINY